MRGYYNIETGDVQYYYGDIDAYRYTVFTTRSKIDSIDYTSPMSKISPRYVREHCSQEDWSCSGKILPGQQVEYDMGLDEIREATESKFAKDAVFFRESIMESQMGRDNARRYQLRYRPVKNLGAGYSQTR